MSRGPSGAVPGRFGHRGRGRSPVHGFHRGVCALPANKTYTKVPPTTKYDPQAVQAPQVPSSSSSEGPRTRSVPRGQPVPQSDQLCWDQTGAWQCSACPRPGPAAGGPGQCQPPAGRASASAPKRPAVLGPYEPVLVDQTKKAPSVHTSDREI